MLFLPPFCLFFFFFSVFYGGCLCVDLTYTVEEEKAVDTFIGDIATDSSIMDSIDPNDLQSIKFSQMQQTSLSLFRISENNGHLFTARRIDAEAICQKGEECFNLIEVVIRKKESFLKLLIIKINIEDLNDNRPEFSSAEIKIKLPENRLPLKATLPIATDNDISPMNSNISYSLSDNIGGLFKLLKNPLSISLERRLDREIQHLYSLQVVAKDRGLPAQKSVLNVLIFVEDANDNVPVFTQASYNGSTENKAQEIIPIVKVQATDLDSGNNGRVSYYLSSKTTDLYRENFKINKKSGNIFLSKEISKPPTSPIQLIVEARDGGRKSSKNNVTVEILIVDQKNHPPLILLNFVRSSSKDSAVISENVDIGSVIAYLKVIDVDQGPNGEVSCSLENQVIQLHKLGEKIYTVIIKENIDREVNDVYNLVVRCQDRGTPALSSEKAFSIQIQDENDNSPSFPLSHYTVSLQENNGMGFPIAQVSASDTDLGPNARVQYYLEPGVEDKFAINENSGIINVKNVFDRETTPLIEFYVFAKDMGKPSHTGSTLMSVKIMDINDEHPIVSEKHLRFKITENLPSVSVGKINASDPDSGPGGQLVYTLIHSNVNFPFTINQAGLITTTEALDYERLSMYRFQVVVSDKGFPVLRTFVEVVVEVVDLNDNAPVFLFPSKKYFSLLTHYSPKTQNNITMLRAFDKDSGRNAFLKYEIVSGNEKGLFSLNLYSGVLSFQRHVTNSDYGTYNLECRVSDGGIPTLSSTVHLSLALLDINNTRLNELQQPGIQKGQGQDQDVLLVVVLAIVTVFVVVAVVGVFCYVRSSDRRVMTGTSFTKPPREHATNKVTVREPLPDDVASEIWKDLGKYKSHVLKGSHLGDRDADMAGIGDIPECTVEYVIEESPKSQRSDVKMNLVVCPDRRSHRSSRASSIIDFGHQDPLRYDNSTLQVQQLAAALQLVAPLGEVVRRLSMVSQGRDERYEDGTQTMASERTDEKSTSQQKESRS